MAATQGTPEECQGLNMVLHTVNLRTRMDPPLPESYFGNVSSFAIALPSMDSAEKCYGMLNLMRDAITDINGDYVRDFKMGIST